MKYVSFLNDSYNLYTIKTDKFKNCHMEIVFKIKCSMNNITSTALLFDLLMECNNEYQSHRDLERHKADLYSTNIYSVNSRVGDLLLTSIITDFLDPKYMEKGTLEKIIKLPFSLIFNPKICDDEFDHELFDLVKDRLINEINAIKDDTKQSSILNALKFLDKDKAYSFNSSGSKEIIDNISFKKLYNYYLDLLNNAYVDIYIIGNLDMEQINKMIHKYALFKSIKTSKLPIYLESSYKKRLKVISESKNLAQMNLVLIYALNDLNSYEANYVMPIFNLLLGSGSLESKLYKRVREESGLCYNINSYYQKYDRLLIIHTAIAPDEYMNCFKLIKGAMNEMIHGHISEAEINNVKEIVINSLNTIYDSPSRLIDNYLFLNLVGLDNIEDRIDTFKTVTIKDVVSITKKIKLVMNYRIGGAHE